MAHMEAEELAAKLRQFDRKQLEFLIYFAHGWEPAAVERAITIEEETGARARAKAAAHTCGCGHLEAYHVGAVLGDKNPGQCTDGDDCDCQRYSAAVLSAVAS